MDTLIRGAMVYDGSGAPSVQRDITIRNDRIVTGSSGTATHVIDAGGLALAPGFIDMHSHADHTLPAFPRATNSICQGVTTEVVGLCGFSVAPVSFERERAAQLHDLAHGFGPDLDWGWHTFAEFLNRVDAAHPAVNIVPLVGHHALRIHTMGMADRAPTPSELEAMRNSLRDALHAGAWGMSTGLIYAPGAFATTEELIGLGSVLNDAGAIYVSHLRDESDHLVDAIDEALRIGEACRIQVQVSHLKITARRNAGKIGHAIENLNRAREGGVRVHADVYPYVAGSTYLHQVLPPWAKAGGLSEMLQRLESDEVRHRIRHDLLQEGTWANQLSAAGGWHNILVTSVQNSVRRDAEGGRVADLARTAGIDPLDYTLDLLREDRGATTMVVFHMDETDMRAALSWPFAAVGSDQLVVTSPTARVHPRAYGTFARVLGWGVRDARLFSLEEAVRKMTGLSAQILGLRDRGRIVDGAIADLVLFDPSTVADDATYEEPTRPPVGVEYVFLSGELAVEKGKAVRLDLGSVLRYR